MRSVICALFVVNWFSLKSIAIGKRGHVLSCADGQSRKPAVGYDAGIAGYFDKNIFKTKLEAEKPVSFIFPGDNRARRIDIVKAARLADRGFSPENNKNA